MIVAYTTKAYDIAHSAGWDAGNRSMRKHGRSQWGEEDLQAAIDTYNKVIDKEVVKNLRKLRKESEIK